MEMAANSESLEGLGMPNCMLRARTWERFVYNDFRVWAELDVVHLYDVHVIKPQSRKALVLQNKTRVEH
jgi:predicted phosphatase